MKTIGLPLFAEAPATDEAAAFKRICEQHQSRALIKVRDIELDLRQPDDVTKLTNLSGHFIRIVTDGPDEADMASAIHHQLAKDDFCY